MRNRAAQGEPEFIGKRIELDAHGQPAISAKLHRIPLCRFLARSKNGFARRFLLLNETSANGQSAKLRFGFGMRRQRLPILRKAFQQLCVVLQLPRKNFQQLIFQPILLALVVGLHQPQTCHVHIQIHFFP